MANVILFLILVSVASASDIRNLTWGMSLTDAVKTEVGKHPDPRYADSLIQSISFTKPLTIKDKKVQIFTAGVELGYAVVQMKLIFLDDKLVEVIYEAPRGQYNSMFHFMSLKYKQPHRTIVNDTLSQKPVDPEKVLSKKGYVDLTYTWSTPMTPRTSIELRHKKNSTGEITRIRYYDTQADDIMKKIRESVRQADKDEAAAKQRNEGRLMLRDF
jgi:hypothetical protein